MNDKDFGIKRLCLNALFIALYVALCIIFQPISFKEMQVRIAECLCVLALFDSYAVISISIACLIANFVGGGVILDVVLGSVATFIGLFCIKFVKIDNFFLKMFPTVLSNGIIIPFVLRYGYGVNMPIIISSLWIMLGEVVAVFILGYILYHIIKKTNLYKIYD